MTLIFLITATFILLYIPIIIGINLMHLLAVVAVVYLLLHYGLTQKIVLKKESFVVVFVLVVMTVYLFFISQYNNSSVGIIGSNVYLIMETIPVSIMLILLAHKKNIDIMFLFVYAALIQSGLAIITYLIPELQQFFVSQLTSYGANDVIADISSYRMYGFSNALTFATPALQSIIAFFVILKIRNKQWRRSWSWAVPVILFSAFVNARTSMVVILIGIGLMYIFGLSKNYVRLPFLIGLFIVILSYVFSEGAIVNLDSENQTLDWIVTGYNEIIGFLNGNVEKGYFSYVTNENQYRLPEGLGKIFGQGTRVMQVNVTNYRSDVGYINDIWLGGITYAVILVILSTYVLKVSKKKMNILDLKDGNLILTFITITVMALNFKGYIFGFNPVINFLAVMYFNLIYKEQFVKKMSTF